MSSPDLFPLGLSTAIGHAWRADPDLTDLLKRFENSSLGALDPINMVRRAIPADCIWCPAASAIWCRCWRRAA